MTVLQEKDINFLNATEIKANRLILVANKIKRDLIYLKANKKSTPKHHQQQASAKGDAYCYIDEFVKLK
ncbi:MAG: hypothetical protein KKF44_04370 [Nanoarchaeota archaeon]|nr:hypothetical protein [Nanoarchaeota archaeon]